MLVRVIRPTGSEREVEIHSQEMLDKFISWHAEEGYCVDVVPDGDAVELICSFEQQLSAVG